jgi:hypothetical protein
MAAEIRDRDTRVNALQQRWDRIRAALDQLLEERGAELADRAYTQLP